MMGNFLGADTFMILTSIDSVRVNFGTAEERVLTEVTVRQLCDYAKEGQFAAGSMGPKVEAAARFVEGGGRRAVIAHLDDAMAALEGTRGTHILHN